MNDKDLRRIANEVAAARIIKPANQVDVGKWGMPKDAHLLRVPSAFTDDVIELFSGDGPKGDRMPAGKTADKMRFRPGEVTIWGGYKKSYKSTFTNELFTYWAAAGIPVCVASLEMPAASLLHKTVMQAAHDDKPTPERITDVLERLSESMTLYDITGRVPLRNMLAVMHYSAVELKARHFLMDNLTALLSVDAEAAETHRQFIADVCTIAKATGMHIHLVAHCAKPEKGDESKVPSGYNLRGTGSAPDLADNILMVWRNKPKEDKIDEGRDTFEVQNEPDIIVLVDEQRHWDFRGRINYWLDRRTLRFKPKREEYPEPMM